MNKTPATIYLTDQEVREGEEYAERYRQDIHAANLAIARAFDNMIQEESK